MTTRTTERTYAASHTELTVTAGQRGARARVQMFTAGTTGASLLRPVLLRSGPSWAEVALVAEGAMLLAGDHLQVTVDVGPGVRLKVMEPSGVVAYAMRGHSASWDVTITQASGSALAWHGQPFVVAADAVVHRRTHAQLAADAQLLFRETSVLGRFGEQPGALFSSTQIRRGAAPVLVEDLELSGRSQVPGLIGPHRVLDSVLALGHPAAESPLRLDLDSGDHLYRELVSEAHHSRLNPLWRELDQSLTEV